MVKCKSFWRLNQQKRVEKFFALSFFKNLQFDPIPTRLCHVIYCHGDKNYPCLVEVGLTEIDSLYCHRISEIKKKSSNFFKIKILLGSSYASFPKMLKFSKISNFSPKFFDKSADI